MKDGRYYSKTEERYLMLYHMNVKCECQECNKECKNPICFVYEDDEEGLENVVGSECIKKYKMIRV